jgi:predicted RND superfamily exporter protein
MNCNQNGSRVEDMCGINALIGIRTMYVNVLPILPQLLYIYLHSKIEQEATNENMNKKDKIKKTTPPSHLG